MTPAKWFAEFRQRVRAHRLSELLPVLARIAVSHGVPPYEIDKLQPLMPWSIPVIARESILWGNEYRGAPVTARSLIRLAAFLQNEPALDVGSGLLHPLMTRYSYEQFPYQESIFEEVSRSHALFIEGARSLSLEVVNDDAWAEILGAPLGQVVGATFFLQVAADENSGFFDRGLLDREDLASVYESWPREVVELVLGSLSSTKDEFRGAYKQARQVDAGAERWGYNPLTERPFMRMSDGRYLAPQPRLILRSVSPGRLYYAGKAAYGKAFTRDLGHLAEHYVGRQLALVPDAELHGEIIYGRSNSKSIDWFLVLPKVVVLIEVKSARLGTVHRAGGDGLDDSVAGLLNRAVGQLDRTLAEIRARAMEFANIPDDRPLMNMIVTTEPFYLANTPWARDLINEPSIPTVVASLRDLEFLVTLPRDELEDRLVEIARGLLPGWELTGVLKGAEIHDNTVLRSAWNSYPWPAGITT